jgi:anti-sigma regulatory factor (Ser/Thr protein kinase)
MSHFGKPIIRSTVEGVTPKEWCRPDWQPGSPEPDGSSVAAPVNARLWVEPNPEAVAGMRRFTQQRAAALGADEEAQATATLLVSELLTNVVLHARTSALVDVAERGDYVYVSITDGNPMPPLLRSLRPDDVSGRGMRLVKEMSASSGVECDDAVTPGGKRVWFAVAKATPPVPAVNMDAHWNSILESLSELVLGARTAPLPGELPSLAGPAGP